MLKASFHYYWHADMILVGLCLIIMTVGLLFDWIPTVAHTQRSDLNEIYVDKE